MQWTPIDYVAFTLYHEQYEIVSFSDMTALERAHLIEHWEDIVEKHLKNEDIKHNIIKKIYEKAKLICSQIRIHEEEHRSKP